MCDNEILSAMELRLKLERVLSAVGFKYGTARLVGQFLTY